MVYYQSELIHVSSNLRIEWMYYCILSKQISSHWCEFFRVALLYVDQQIFCHIGSNWKVFHLYAHFLYGHANFPIEWTLFYKGSSWIIHHQCTVAKKQQTVLVNWGLKERWFWMVLRVLDQILEIPKLGKAPRAHLGPIWPDLAKIWPNKIDLGNPQGYLWMCEGLHLGVI